MDPRGCHDEHDETRSINIHPCDRVTRGSRRCIRPSSPPSAMFALRIGSILEMPSARNSLVGQLGIGRTLLPALEPECSPKDACTHIRERWRERGRLSPSLHLTSLTARECDVGAEESGSRPRAPLHAGVSCVSGIAFAASSCDRCCPKSPSIGRGHGAFSSLRAPCSISHRSSTAGASCPLSL